MDKEYGKEYVEFFSRDAAWAVQWGHREFLVNINYAEFTGHKDPSKGVYVVYIHRVTEEKLVCYTPDDDEAARWVELIQLAKRDDVGVAINLKWDYNRESFS